MDLFMQRLPKGRTRKLRTSQDTSQSKANSHRQRRFETLENRWMLSASPIYSLGQELTMSGETEQAIEVAHSDSLELDAGTFALTFSVDDAEQFQTLFSKDHSGYQEGGHLTVWTTEGSVKVRFQSDSRSVYLYSAEDSIRSGEEHHLAVSFGEEGTRLYVDGLIADAEVRFDQTIATNDNSLYIGASTAWRTEEYDSLNSPLDGTISTFEVYNEQLDLSEVAELAGLDLSPPSEPTLVEGVLMGTDRRDNIYDQQFVEAGYGNDTVMGTNEADVLAGGHGEDILIGGRGNDLLISRSDGREPALAQEYDAADDPYGLIDPLTRTLYPEQPIASDDLLIGGPGADTFRFEILVNAKEEILFRHVEDDGTIDWKGVTGENRYAHDHWVDRLGDEVIFDFNREQGDVIEIVGHTVDVYKVTHEDKDGDGVLDASVLHLQSNQGNAGAHNRDKLGSVTVFGDLVREGDYTVDAHANLGIVETIGELGEALEPRHSSPLVNDGTSKWARHYQSRKELPTGAIFAVGQELPLNAEQEEHINVPHNDSLELESGTFAMSFSVEDAGSYQTLFSKDHSGYQEGGHLTVWTVEGSVKVRLQSDSRSVYLYSAIDSIRSGEEHHVAVSFGEEGARLYVDGLIADAEVTFDQTIVLNDNSLVIGADTTSRNEDRENLKAFFTGQISEFTIYDSQLSLEQVAELAGVDLSSPSEPTVIEGVLTGTDRGEALKGRHVEGGYGDDTVNGTSKADVLAGGHGEDKLVGGRGNDLLISRSDGREPALAQEYDAADDPYGLIDPLTRTLYPEQPIASDDLLIGGPGADTFRFEILINAKEEILFRHVEDDGTIDWKGVTGENRYAHDHWVDRLGDEVISDFNREEGDVIEIVGHTVDVYKLTYEDTDGDGVLDASVIHLQSNQGNAGAHNRDKLGTVTVFGDLLREDDYTVDAHANLGIVETIGELGEALEPRDYSPLVNDGTSKWLPKNAPDTPLPVDAVFAVGQPIEFFEEQEHALSTSHSDRLELDNGTIALSFIAEDLDGRQALFSKDHSGFQQGGHLTVELVHDRIEVRLQSDSESVYLHSDWDSISAGVEHEVAVSFGSAGLMLYLDGVLVDSALEFTQGIAANDNELFFGASAKSRDGDHLNLRNFFEGVIEDFVVYDEQLSEDSIDAAFAEPNLV